MEEWCWDMLTDKVGICSSLPFLGLVGILSFLFGAEGKTIPTSF